MPFDSLFFSKALDCIAVFRLISDGVVKLRVKMLTRTLKFTRMTHSGAAQGISGWQLVRDVGCRNFITSKQYPDTLQQFAALRRTNSRPFQSRRHGGPLVGLAPQTKLQTPPNEKRKL